MFKLGIKPLLNDLYFVYSDCYMCNACVIFAVKMIEQDTNQYNLYRAVYFNFYTCSCIKSTNVYVKPCGE